MKILRTAILVPNFTGSYKKECTPFCHTSVKFVAIFCKIVMFFFLAEIQQAMTFSMLQTKKLTKSCDTALEVHYFELGAINLHFKKDGS